jgi:hypothetical protein
MAMWNNIVFHQHNARACILFAMPLRAKLTQFAVAATKINTRSLQTRTGAQGWTVQAVTAFIVSRPWQRYPTVFVMWTPHRQPAISATRTHLRNLTSTKATGWHKAR